MKAISGTNLEQAKSHNRRVVIEAVRTNGPLSRAAIARMTALTAQTVSNIVEELERSHLLVPSEPQKLARGRPIIPYTINPRGAYSIGLELGRQRASGVLTDLSGAVCARIERHVEHPDPQRAMPALQSIVEDLQQAFTFDRNRLLGVGMALPGRYADGGTTSLSPQSLPGWQDFPVALELEQRVRVPVLVENDATAAAIGERLHGVARGLGSFVYLFLAGGGGIGAGMFLDGHLYKGSRNNAGEIGHVIVEPHGKLCSCGKRGCLDRYVSPAVAYEFMGIANAEELSPDDLDALIAKGGEGLDAWLDQAVQPLRQTVDFLELAFDPQTIVLGGSISTSLMRRLAERLEPLHTPIDPSQKRTIPRVMIGMTGKDTAILGAAALPIFSETNPRFDVLQKPLG
ncbi:ROK family transcriptional regulator (plasmid) [Rhizobium leguminosarum]|uniref:ROK family transcriptional regulator n=1 Tax=Rhizobium leguminosarum TaxID=384 RepID=UPI0014416BFD|nr:ROK family transcriptional regulator [Rhizobium leguminosarum]MBY5835469.1 ROK family transcriptional regulator [Rhizobium leguminosarum]NKM78106.1 ROK family protein [Rhizobium leguminosarum bv. viciae]QSZ11688.1 ROK family transcriptional regulator [Rhizobium leguminosarum]